MARTRKITPAPCGLHEDLVRLDGLTFQARRNAPDANDARWQIFTLATSGPGPVAIVEVHACPDHGGRPALTVTDASDLPIAQFANHGGRVRTTCSTYGPCLADYSQALAAIVADVRASEQGPDVWALGTTAMADHLMAAVKRAGARSIRFHPAPGAGTSVRGSRADVTTLRRELLRSGYRVNVARMD